MNCGKCGLAKYNDILFNIGPNGAYQFDQRNDRNSWKSPPTQQNNDNQMLSDQEQQFDVMFSAWEQGFDSWKRENQNNPDQVIQYNLQIHSFE